MVRQADADTPRRIRDHNDFVGIMDRAAQKGEFGREHEERLKRLRLSQMRDMQLEGGDKMSRKTDSRSYTPEEQEDRLMKKDEYRQERDERIKMPEKNRQDQRQQQAGIAERFLERAPKGASPDDPRVIFWEEMDKAGKLVEKYKQATLKQQENMAADMTGDQKAMDKQDRIIAKQEQRISKIEGKLRKRIADAMDKAGYTPVPEVADVLLERFARGDQGAGLRIATQQENRDSAGEMVVEAPKNLPMNKNMARVAGGYGRGGGKARSAPADMRRFEAAPPVDYVAA